MLFRSVHGPQPRDYSQKINVKSSRAALRVALSDKVRNKAFVVVNDFDLQKYSTKHIVESLKSLGQDETVLLADERKDHFLYRSARNIHGVSAMSASEINAENVLRHKAIVLSEIALQSITARLTKEAQ